MKTASAIRRFGLSCSIAVVAALLTSCAFTQWTEHGYFGTPGNRPVHENHVGTGIAILPFAIVADVVTLPVQAVLLIIMGDDFLYKKSSSVSTYAAGSPSTGDHPMAALGAAGRERLSQEARRRLEALDREPNTAPVAFAIALDGSTREIPLSTEALSELQRRVRPEQVYPRGSLATCGALQGQ